MSIRGDETKLRILSIASDELALKGPHALHMHDLIEKMGVTQAMVNYHFGGRWGLIEAAVLESYRSYVELMLKQLDKKLEPVEKLLAWAEAQVNWTVRHPGIAVLLNFPNLVPEVNFKSGDTYTEIQRIGQQHVNAVIGVVSEALSKIMEQPVDAEVASLRTATFMWTVLGVATWSAGKHAPTRNAYNVQMTMVVSQLKDLVNNWLLNPRILLGTGPNSAIRS